MRLMLGLDRGAGRTTFDGQTFDQLKAPMTRIGSLLEAKPFHPTRKARSHLRMLAASNGISVSRVDEVLEQLGLTTVASKQPRTFSLGMGQRLGLAAALLGDPDTLILDEPANGLDPQGIQWLRMLLKHLASQGRSVLVSSHLLSETALMADDLVVIGRGQLIASGPIDDFVKSSTGSWVLVRTPDSHKLIPLLAAAGATVEGTDGALTVRGMTAQQIGELAHTNSVRLHELASREATLEEAFLQATGGYQEYNAEVADEGSLA
jgi:ABC-2 type transport system ATP-binding protein